MTLKWEFFKKFRGKNAVILTRELKEIDWFLFVNILKEINSKMRWRIFEKKGQVWKISLKRIIKK